MTFKSIFQNAYNALVKSGYNSISSAGSVLRNYARRSAFRPEEQLQGITYKAIDKAGRSVGQYELVVNKKDGKPYVNHPLYNLWRNPNPRQTASDFQHLYSMLMDIFGETFWYKVRGEETGRLKELYLLLPSQVEVRIDGGEIVGYILHKRDGTQVPFSPDEIYHDKYPNPFNELRGLSILEKSAVYVDTEISTSVFTLNYIKNNASPSGIVSLPSMDKETFKQFASQWREGYEGPENAGKTAFIRGGEASFKAVGATLKDIDQKVTRDMAKEDVLMMLDMPKGMLGVSDQAGLGRAGIETTFFIYNSEKVDPIMKRLDLIYASFLKDLGRGTDTAVTVTHVSPVPEDKEYELNMYKAGVNKWITANEIRAKQGLEPLPEGNVLVLDNTVANTTGKSDKTVKRIVFKKKLTKAEELKNTKASQDAFQEQLISTADIYSDKIKHAISKYSLEQEKKVIANMGATGKDDTSDWLFNVKEESIALALILTPLIIELMKTQMEATTNFITGEAVTLPVGAEKAIQTNMLQIAGDFNSETVKEIQKTLAQGTANNETLVQLKKRIEAVYDGPKGWKAERIARTEALKASNESAAQVYFENGFSELKWFVNPNACEFCVTMANQVRAINSSYKSVGDVVTSEAGNQLRIEYRDIATPPLHPNCKCSEIPASF